MGHRKEDEEVASRLKNLSIVFWLEIRKKNQNRKEKTKLKQKKLIIKREISIKDRRRRNSIKEGGIHIIIHTQLQGRKEVVGNKRKQIANKKGEARILRKQNKFIRITCELNFVKAMLDF